ncbi:MAG TPA: ATP-binding protein [bacterium]|nr:ATP-binding protein [bacterium]
MSKRPEEKKKSKPSQAARRALEDLKGLLLLDGVLKDPVGEALARLLKWLAKEDAEPQRGLRRYGKLWRCLMESGVLERKGRVGNLLQDHLLERLLTDDNPFHRRAEQGPLPGMDPSLHSFYMKDLAAMRRVLKTDWEAEFFKRSSSLGEVKAPSLEGAREPKGSVPETAQAKTRRRLKEKLLGSAGPEVAAEVGNYFLQYGLGDFGRYRAFRWKDGLQGVAVPDPIRLEELVGYDEQRQPLLENIEAFVKGKSANHALIYGERGTGKSSTVKALLNRYGDQGLRLVEVHPDQLNEYPRILPLLRGRREKFILFVDDLSFEENETGYKGLKALLEGSVEAKPSNVILIATSNRRHLIREFFADRAGGLQQEGEIHGADTVEEKLSLSDRFGLVISFYSPDQDIYLQMVENWARVEGIKLPAAELRARAIQWEKANNVRSGRTARQFINDLLGKV